MGEARVPSVGVVMDGGGARGWVLASTSGHVRCCADMRLCGTDGCEVLTLVDMLEVEVAQKKWVGGEVRKRQMR